MQVIDNKDFYGRNRAAFLFLERQMITTERVLITPDIAKAMLSSSKGNRGIRRNKVDAYKEAMLAGEWKENGDTIRFYADGSMQDGHHRLTAGIESGVSFYALVVRGLDKQSAKTVDKGASRNNADELALHAGFTPDDARIAAGIARYVIVHDLGYESWVAPGGNSTKHLTAIRVSDWIEDNQETVSDAVEWSKETVRRGNSMLTKAAVAALYILGSRIDKDEASDFLEQVFLGYNVSPGSTADHVRSALLGAAMGGRAMRQNMRILSTAKSMKSVLSGRNIKHANNAMFRPGKDSVPMFPIR